MKNGVICLGEALIDFIPLEKTNTTYHKSPGGAPANVAVGLAQLGTKSTFLGKVGNDILGRFLKETLENSGVRTNQMLLTSEAATGIVFVTNTEDGERSFDFYIDPSADRFLRVNDIVEADFEDHKILYFGSISMISEPSKEATHYAVKLAKERGMVISYDPNLRLSLWDTEEHARETIVSMLGYADTLKLSEEELEFITGEQEITKGIERLKPYNIPLIFISLGAEGSYVYTSEKYEHVPAMKVKAVDTTGAGDAFVSGILYSLNEYGSDICSIPHEAVIEIAKFASVSGALAASTKGAMSALPRLEEVTKQLHKKEEQRMSTDQRLRHEVYEVIERNKELVKKDPYRLHYHVMPPVGLLNDPNGFIQWNGTYHLFYQWMPFKTGHGAKFWGHYTTDDFVNWKHEEIALTPAEWFEKNGCYSGSAIEHEGKMYLFYTGNVKDENGKRETYQCLAVSNDGVTFEKLGPIVELPKGYTSHFRDPKVWKQNNQYFMVVGAQTSNLKGAVALFESENLTKWEHKGILVGGGKENLKDFGYMFECPDLFPLDHADVLIFSPQGKAPEDLKYQNLYQAGYVIGRFDPEKRMYNHNEFNELDRGFDLYAPQTTLDDQGRRLMFAWMSVPNQGEQHHPTIKHKWLHNMTLPRELKVEGGKLIQRPIKELEQLRIDDPVKSKVTLVNETRKIAGVSGKSVELLLENILLQEGWFEIGFAGNARLIYSKEDKFLTLERKSFVNGMIEKRQCKVEKLEALNIFIDTSSIEIFVNNGEETFTSRFYPDPKNEKIEFGASKESNFEITKWSLDKIF